MLKLLKQEIVEGNEMFIAFTRKEKEENGKEILVTFNILCHLV